MMKNKSIYERTCLWRKQLFIKLFLAISVLLCTSGIYAQEVIVKGVVTGAKDNVTMPGVNVSVKGTTTGTITDIDGNYSIKASANNVLVFSFIGYSTQEVKVAGQTEINILLNENLIDIDEVVVIGYGTAKKSDFTGSLSNIKADDFKNEPITKLSQALQGRASGVMVSSTSGAPGAAAKIRIRGLNSIFGNNEPLYIVDGMAANANSFNVNDIESIEVLKDASATAIYGNRGANGVILISTRKGKKGKTSVDLDYTIGFDQLPLSRLIPTLSAYDYMNVTNAIVSKSYTDEEIEEVLLNGPNTNWQDEIFRSGFTHNYQLSISGGSEKTMYYISGNYIDQTGIVMNTGNKQYSLRTNIETALTKNIKFLLNNNVSYKDVHNGAPADIQEAIVWSPNLPVKDSTGQYTPIDFVGHQHGRNPVASLDAQNSNWGTVFVNTKAEMKWEILPGLTFNPIVGLDYSNFTNKWFTGSGRTGSLPNSGLGNSSSRTIQNSNILNYNTTFGDHALTATLVHEWISYRSYGYGFSEEAIPNDYFGFYKFGTGAVQSRPYSHYTESNLLSYLGRLNYNYQKKYYLTASLRADASSKFRDENKWGYFPSAALSWIASNEQFIKDLNLFDLLKVRLSYGEVGSQAISPYQTMSVMGSGANYAYPYATPDINFGFGLAGYPNKGLKWETTSTLNFGVDMSLLDSRLNVTADIFNKNTTDMLYPKAIPGYQGGGTIMTNVGTMNNKGFELTLGGYPVSTKDFKWNSQLNLSYIKNTVSSLADSVLVGPNFWGSVTIHRTLEGKPASSFYALDFQGTWKEAELAEAAIYGAKPGMGKYRDVNDDKKINDQDYIYAGSPYPDLYLSWTNDFSYKNWELSIFMYASEGAKLFNHNYLMMNLNTVWSSSVTHADGLNYYDPVTNPTSNYPSLIASEPYNSTRFIEDASYIRIKNISLAYTIDRKWANIADVKLAASVQNAFLITNYRGYDPEYLGGGNDVYVGFDAGVYPTPRSYSFSVKIRF